MTHKRTLQIACFLGATAIILGAFGAHALKNVLTQVQLESFETGVRYQFYHALFLLFISIAPTISVKQKNILTSLATIGVLFFSGSIYLLATQNIAGFKASFLGPITPIGGLFMISTWILLLVFVSFQKNNNK